MPFRRANSPNVRSFFQRVRWTIALFARANARPVSWLLCFALSVLRLTSVVLCIVVSFVSVVSFLCFSHLFGLLSFPQAVAERRDGERIARAIRNKVGYPFWLVVAFFALLTSC